MTQRAVVSSAILILVGTAGVLFAYGQMLTHAPEMASPVPFDTVYLGIDASGYSHVAYIVIDNQSSWSRVWDTAFCSQGRWCQLPDVNFTLKTVIAVFYGFHGHTSDTILVDEASHTTSTLNVQVLSRAGGNCQTPLVTFYPAHIIDIPKTDLKVSFITKIVPTNC